MKESGGKCPGQVDLLWKYIFWCNSQSSGRSAYHEADGVDLMGGVSTSTVVGINCWKESPREVADVPN